MEYLTDFLIIQLTLSTFLIFTFHLMWVLSYLTLTPLGYHCRIQCHVFFTAHCHSYRNDSCNNNLFNMNDLYNVYISSINSINLHIKCLLDNKIEKINFTLKITKHYFYFILKHKSKETNIKLMHTFNET